MRLELGRFGLVERGHRVEVVYLEAGDDALVRRFSETRRPHPMAEGSDLHPVQRKFLELGALQCGFCTPGFIVAAKAELKSQPMAAGHTYTYPLSILGNFGYTGKVTLDAGLTYFDWGATGLMARSTREEIDRYCALLADCPAAKDATLTPSRIIRSTRSGASAPSARMLTPNGSSASITAL